MRLLDVQTYRLHTFYGEKIPPYAILSHTWLQDHEEVTFAHLESQPPNEWGHLPGARKIELTCWQAASDGYSWAWVDTCCIDKTNNAELSEAINSMFNWYTRSEICYVYLMDIDLTTGQNDILTSRWWSRAWTLQELVAPTKVHFYDAQWRPTGSKTDHAESIANSMKIDQISLRQPQSIFNRSVAQRMSWAAYRRASRDEDLAYSLLGIFNINMTMQYGEGERAFLRLQKEITRTTNDMSMFAWGFNAEPVGDVCGNVDAMPLQGYLVADGTFHHADQINSSPYGLFAASPSDFSNTQDIVQLAHDVSGAGVEERHGTQTLNTAMLLSPRFTEGLGPTWAIAILPCMLAGDHYSLVGVLLRGWHDHRTMRYAFGDRVYSCLIPSRDARDAVLHHLEIDTLETQSSLSSPQLSFAHATTMIIEFDDITDYPFKILSPTTWQGDARQPYCFTTEHLEPESFSFLRFHKPGSPLAVYIGYRLDLNTKLKQREQRSEFLDATILAATVSTPDWQVWEEMQNTQNFPETNRVTHSRVRCRSTCGHDRLYVDVALRKIFNQAIVTVTLRKRGAGVVVERQDALCLKREEWFSEQVPKLPDKPRKKGLLRWTKD